MLNSSTRTSSEPTESSIPTSLAKSVNHSLMYSDGDIHVNGVENFSSLLKRGVMGTFQKLSTKHLGRYLNEFILWFKDQMSEDLFVSV